MRRWAESAVMVPEIREEAKAWCETHKIDPADVPMNGLIREGPDGWVEIEVFERDMDGVIKWDHDAADGEGRPISQWLVAKGPVPPHLTEDVEL